MEASFPPTAFDGGVIVAPSILSADFGALDAAVDAIAGDADWVHVDVMDGHFVPNLTIGPPVVSSLRKHTSMFLDCHLMITNPGELLPAFAEAGASSCTVHVEVGGTPSLIAQMRDLGLGVGIALNPETPAESVLPFLSDVDLVLVMTVHPGFGGQSFLAEVLPKLGEVSRAAEDCGSQVVVQVDGGIDVETAPLSAAAGARAFVAGSAVFGHADPARACRDLRASVRSS